MVCAYINSQRLRQHAQGQHRTVPDGVLELNGEVDICLIPNSEEIPN